MTDEPKVLVERDTPNHPIVRVWFNRPKQHNAFDGEALEQLLAAFDQIANDDTARVIVLGGKGKSFCAGADLKWMAKQGRSSDNASGTQTIGRLFDVINDSPKPVIGRVHGAVRGGGNGVVACCDIPVGTVNATFALTEVRLGLAPAVISPYVIGRMGIPAARELFLTGSKFDAHRAKDLNMLHRVCETEEELDAAIARIAGDIAKGGPNAVATCKQLALTVMDVPKAERLAHTSGILAGLRSSKEAQEGMMSFIQKRPAKWVTDAAGEGGS